MSRPHTDSSSSDSRDNVEEEELQSVKNISGNDVSAYDTAQEYVTL